VARAWRRPWLSPAWLVPRLVPAALALVPAERDGVTHLALDSVRCGAWEVFTLGVVWHGRVLPRGPALVARTQGDRDRRSARTAEGAWRKGAAQCAPKRQGPNWLHDPAAYVAACAELYEEIDRLGAQLSEARERAKADLLIHLSGKHPVVLAFDSRLITLGDLQRWLHEAGDHTVVLATGFDPAGRRQVRKAAARGSIASRLIALCSDAMAEGFNLQGASAVVHLDTPSVIRTAEQRAGRVDRLDSPHPTIEVWWPRDADEFALRQDERFLERYQCSSPTSSGRTFASLRWRTV
jgi:hypothetical protein